MNIVVEFTPDRRRALPVLLRQRRRLRWALRGVGMIALVAAALTAAAGSAADAALLAVLGVVLFAEVDALTWIQLRRWDLFTDPVTLTITEQGLARQTALASLQLPWSQVQRIIHHRQFWIFTGHGQWVAVHKALLTSEQQTELAAFLTADHRLPGRMSPPGSPAAPRGPG